MANGADIAKAYVQIIPSADGIKGQLTEIMGGEAERAGKASGGKFGASMGKALKVTGAAAAAFTGATVAMTGAIVKGAAETAEYGDNIDKMSQKLGLSYKSFQQWDYVLSQSGADINSMGTGLKTLTNKLDDAKNGSESAQAMFAQLGLSMEDLANMSREDVFAAVVSGFQGMADSTERAALANDLFGKSGQELTPLFNTSVEETQALMAATDELGMIMSDDAVTASANYKDSLDTLQRTFGGLKNSLLTEFMPSITSVMDGLSALISGDSSGLEQVKVGISSFIKHLSSALPQIISVGAELVVTLAQALISNLPQLLTAGMEAIKTIGEGLLLNLPMILQTALELILTLARGLTEAAPTLIPAVASVIADLVTMLTDPNMMNQLVDAAMDLLMALADGLIAAIPVIIDAAPQIIENFMLSIADLSPKLLEMGILLTIKLVGGILGSIDKLIAAAPQLIKALVNGIVASFTELYKVGKDMVGKVKDAVVGVAKSLMGGAGMQIVQGIWQGISNGYSWITQRIRGWVGNVVSFFKKILKIGSPSKLFADEIGIQMAAGIGVGFENGMQDVEDIMRDSIPTANDLLGSPFSGSRAYGGSLAPAYNYGGVTINILGREKDAEQLAVELQAALVRRTAVWA